MTRFIRLHKAFDRLCELLMAKEYLFWQGFSDIFLLNLLILRLSMVVKTNATTTGGQTFDNSMTMTVYR